MEESQLKAIRNFAKEMETHGTKQVEANLEYTERLIQHIKVLDDKALKLKQQVKELITEMHHKNLLLKQFQEKYQDLEAQLEHEKKHNAALYNKYSALQDMVDRTIQRGLGDD